MSATAIFTMIVILTIVWGGFIFSLRAAIKKESEKSSSETTQ